MKFIKKYKKVIIIVVIGLLFILSGWLAWNLHFSKFHIFNNQEKDFLEAVQRYYEFNPNFLPKKGQAKEMTLQDLYDGAHINSLHVPKSKKLCDINSWVRVYHNSKGEYEYFTYLKCGSFESDIDSDGPEITLNGENKIVVALGSQYQEFGVSKVNDKVDGKIKVEDVIIDNSSVNTNKIGTYKVTYTVRDKAYNKTVVTRTVIVSENLTEVVRKNTDDSNYYKGNNVNNYLLFSGMLFRIVNVNEDGTVKLISDEAVTNLRADYSTYEGSNIDTWLKNVYYKALNNPDKYLVDSTYCVGNINSMNDYSTACDTTITSKVGLLSIGDYYNSRVGEETSIYSPGFMLSNKMANHFVNVPYDDSISDNEYQNILAPIRPVITLKSNLYLIGGNGTENSPYKLDDYDYGKSNEKLNKRLIGEYLEYSGLKFRIIGFDSNDNIRVISAQTWSVQPYNTRLYISLADGVTNKFDVKDEKSYGYILNDQFIDYIDTSSLVNTNYVIPTNEKNKKYNEYTTEKVNAKILLPTTYELFSSPGNYGENKSSIYLYIDRSVDDNLVFMSNGQNGLSFELDKLLFDYNLKIVITLKNTLQIQSGKGTLYQPYKVK